MFDSQPQPHKWTEVHIYFFFTKCTGDGRGFLRLVSDQSKDQGGSEGQKGVR